MVEWVLCDILFFGTVISTLEGKREGQHVSEKFKAEPETVTHPQFSLNVCLLGREPRLYQWLRGTRERSRKHALAGLPTVYASGHGSVTKPQISPYLILVRTYIRHKQDSVFHQEITKRTLHSGDQVLKTLALNNQRVTFGWGRGCSSSTILIAMPGIHNFTQGDGIIQGCFSLNPLSIKQRLKNKQTQRSTEICVTNLGLCLGLCLVRVGYARKAKTLFWFTRYPNRSREGLRTKHNCYFWTCFILSPGGHTLYEGVVRTGL